MAGRPIKRNIDYAGWSVNMFESDTKIDKLLDAQSWTGFGIYFYLCQRAYGSDGYYYQWSYDDAATTARKMGGGVGSETIRQVVALCCQIGLFDKRLFEGDGVLTSRGIQKRYYAVIADRPRKQVVREYWLLSPEEAPGLEYICLKKDLSPINGNLPPINEDLSEQKGIKGKESKGKESKDVCVEPQSVSTPAPRDVFISMLLKDNTYHHVTTGEVERYQQLFPTVNVEDELHGMVTWIGRNPNKRPTPRGIRRFIANWLEREQRKGGWSGNPAPQNQYTPQPSLPEGANPFNRKV